MTVHTTKGSLFSLGTVLPTGWLRRQLEVQAAGLSGHLDEFWRDIRDSGWIGGDAEGWERAPYWLDGLVPLAVLLGDEDLIKKVDTWIEFVLDHQQEDGWLGPQKQEQGGFSSERDPWPLYVMLKVLTQYAEARNEDAPGKRAFDAIGRTLRAINAHLDRWPLYEWNQFRWADLLVTIMWYQARAGVEEPILLELAERLHNEGYDWQTHFERFPFHDKSDRWTFDRHVVNNAMGIKAPGLWELYTTGAISASSVLTVIEILDRYHGQANGVFSGDECVAGRMPSQGTELCAVVEYLFSLEQLLPHQGDVRISDRLELIAFNALPAPFAPDMWSHQYDQQVNQAQCVITEDRIYTSNRGDANLYGLEPHFGCCTANMHQGFPKLAASQWYRGNNGSVRAMSYAPCVVELTSRDLPGSDGDTQMDGSVSIEVGGNYPLSENVEITVSGKGTLAEQEQAIELPVPGWAHGATLARDGAPAIPVEAGQLVRLEGRWNGSHKITLTLPMRVRTEFRYNNAVSVYCGPLLFGFQPEEKWEHERGEHPHSDWRVSPQAPWNIAIGLEAGPDWGLSIDRSNTDYNAGLTNLTNNGPVAQLQETGESTSQPAGRAPLRIPVTYRELSSWEIEHGAAAAPPTSPVKPAATEKHGYLVPYGSTGLRIAELPWYWKEPAR